MEQMKSFEQQFNEACEAVSFYDDDKIIRFIEANENNREEILNFIHKKIERAYDFTTFGQYVEYYINYPTSDEEKASLTNEIERGNRLMEGVLNFFTALVKTGKYDLQEYKGAIRSIAYDFSKGWEVGYEFSDNQIQQLREIADYYKDFDFDGLLLLITAEAKHLGAGFKQATLPELANMYVWLKEGGSDHRYDEEVVGYDVHYRLSEEERGQAIKKVAFELICRGFDEKQLNYELSDFGFKDVLKDALEYKIFKNQNELVSYMFKGNYLKTLYDEIVESIDLDEISNENKIKLVNNAYKFVYVNREDFNFCSKVFNSVDINDVETKKQMLGTLYSDLKNSWLNISKKILRDSKKCETPEIQEQYRELFQLWLQRTHLAKNVMTEDAKKVLRLVPEDWEKEKAVLRTKILKDKMAKYESALWGMQEKLCLKQNGFAYGGAMNHIYGEDQYVNGLYYNVKDEPKYRDGFVKKYTIYASIDGVSKQFKAIDMAESNYRRADYENEIAMCRAYIEKYVMPIDKLRYTLGETIEKYEKDFVSLLTPKVENELEGIARSFEITISKLKKAYQAGEKSELVASDKEIVKN